MAFKCRYPLWAIYRNKERWIQVTTYLMHMNCWALLHDRESKTQTQKLRDEKTDQVMCSFCWFYGIGTTSPAHQARSDFPTASSTCSSTLFIPEANKRQTDRQTDSSTHTRPCLALPDGQWWPGEERRESEGHVHKARNRQNKPQEDELHHPELKKKKKILLVCIMCNSLSGIRTAP